MFSNWCWHWWNTSGREQELQLNTAVRVLTENLSLCVTLCLWVSHFLKVKQQTESCFSNETLNVYFSLLSYRILLYKYIVTDYHDNFKVLILFIYTCLATLLMPKGKLLLDSLLQGFCALVKDTSTCGQEKQGVESPIPGFNSRVHWQQPFKVIHSSRNCWNCNVLY